MKNVILSAIIMAFVLVSCNQKIKEGEVTTSETTTKHTESEMYACSMHPEVTGHKGEKCSKCGMELTVPVAAKEAGDDHHDGDHHHDDAAMDMTSTNKGGTAKFSMKDIVSNYIQLKNALSKDDANGAAAAGKTLYAVFNNVNPNSVDAKSKKDYMDIADDAKEHAEHIGDNASKIEHQREHFVMLSKDVNDLVKLFGNGGQKLYQDFCPMADEGKGAIWISEIKEIKNPYMGSKMQTCGKIKKEI